ncbi:hypothetical protein Rcae01_03492 [Novipirellula caenicola]|uniref:Integrase catalytic domain-containing protein n=1 Tax=Novipirellula caenicola TaxID=1536901 RepID=A0ABP9VS95_9BACT
MCVFIDLHSRKVVGWKTSRNIDSELVVSALTQASVLRSPAAGLIVHSDRGSQYASEHFRSRWTAHGLIQSMSRRGNCYDNAPMESFFKSYKTEEAQQIYDTHEQATRGVSNYIEVFITLFACTPHLAIRVPSTSSKPSENRYSSVNPDPQDAPFTFPLRPVHCQLFESNSKKANALVRATVGTRKKKAAPDPAVPLSKTTKRRLRSKRMPHI